VTWTVFDALGYAAKPSLDLAPIEVVEQWRLIPRPHAHALPDWDRVRDLASELASIESPVVLDVECWPLRGVPEVVDLSVERYLWLLLSLRLLTGRTDLGYYGVVPLVDFARARWPDDNPLYQVWVRESLRLVEVGSRVSAAYPCLYSVTDRWPHWEQMARAQVAMAREVAPDVPVRPFVSPYYRPLDGRYVGDEMWRQQLVLLRDLADGVVLFGGQGIQWDGDAPWWRVVREIMA
jgi:hypothetical protein